MFPVFHDTSYATPQQHKNNELGVELIAVEITLSLLLLGKLFVVMDEKEYVDFSSVLPDHCLQNSLVIKGELTDENSNGPENELLNNVPVPEPEKLISRVFYFLSNFGLLFLLLVTDPI